jgi:hypothetical protein
MPIARFEAPAKHHNTGARKGAADVARTAAAYYTGGLYAGIASALKAVTGGRRPMEERHAYHTVPIEVNTDTGQVVAFAGKNKKQTERGARAAPLLAVALATGVAPKKLPSGYKEIGRQVAALHFSNPPEVAAPDEPAQDQPEFKQFDYGDNDMGGFLPPGGLAGFSQMVGASKLALMRGGRRMGSTGRRKRRAKRKAARAQPRARKKKSRARKGRARLVKGSAAAKRYMASIRKKRKRA